ncbi:T9SS type B sorting domain-containing protein [bacterium]|nr:T9SS type B sorting domain-containing protein [bacterium]
MLGSTIFVQQRGKGFPLRRENIKAGVWLAALLMLLYCTALFPQTGRKALLNPFRGNKISVQNEEIRITVSDEDGRFTIGTVSGKPLLFGYPAEGATSHTNFNIDGDIWCNISNPGSHPPEMTMVTAPAEVDGSIICRWREGDIRITQRLTPTEIGGLSVILIEYTAVNLGIHPHQVGFLLFMDTMINRNDYAPIATQYGYFAVEREFSAPTIPLYWQAFEEDPFQPPEMLIGEGILYGGEAVMPDNLVYGDYWGYSRVEWDYTVSGTPYTDSSVLLRWELQTLLPGAERRVGTYYGKGTSATTIGILSLSLTAPDALLFTECDELSPNPFVINLFIASTMLDIVEDAYAILDMPPIFVAGDPISIVDPPILYSGATGLATWEVGIIEPAPVDTIIHYRIRVIIPETDTFTIIDSIYIPSNDYRAPNYEILSPEAGQVYSCDSLLISIFLNDPDGINLESFLFNLGSRSFAISDLRHHIYSHGSLNGYVHTSDFLDGRLNFNLEISDLRGCHTASPVQDLSLDREPPRIVRTTPSEHGVVTGSSFTVRVDFDDEHGINTDSLLIVIQDSIMLTAASWGVSMEGEELSIQGSIFTAISTSLDTIEVCLHKVMDNVSRCSYNRRYLPYCWSFIVDNQPPQVEVIDPVPGSYLSCPELNSRVIVRHPLGILASSISLEVNERRYSIYSPELSLSGDTLLINLPDYHLAEGVLQFDLNLEDVHGSGLPEPCNWQYTLDWNAPRIEPRNPGSHSVISNPWDSVIVVIEDTLSGVDLSTLELSISSGVFSLLFEPGDEGIYFIDNVLFLVPEEAGFRWPGRDTITIAVNACDMAGYCDPNCSPTNQWSFYTPGQGPVAESITSSLLRNISCDNLIFKWFVEDEEGIEYHSVSVNIGSLYTISYGEDGIEWRGDTLVVGYPAEFLPQGELLHARIASLDDLFLNPLYSAEEIIFSLDNTPPLIEYLSPGADSYVETIYPTLILEVSDEHSDIDPLLTHLEVNGIAIGEDVEFEREGDNLIIDLAYYASLLTLEWGDTVELCLHLFDKAVECEPNRNDTCWSIYIQESGSEICLVSPDNGSSYACDMLEIEIYMSDPEGINGESIIFRFGDMLYTISDTELDYTGNLLHFWLASVIGLYDTVYFGIEEAIDSMGFPLYLPLEHWSVVLDWNAPRVSDIEPAAGSQLDFDAPQVIMQLEDESGISSNRCVIWVNGTEYDMTSGLLEYSEPNLYFNIRDIQGELAETNQVCLSIRDDPDYCFNENYECWQYIFVNNPPSLNLIYPPEHSIISCEESFIKIAIMDEQGIYPESLNIKLSGNDICYEDGYFEILGDTVLLQYNRDIILEGPCNIECSNLYDSSGLASSQNFSWEITFDFSPPQLSGVWPPEEMDITPDLELIKVLLYDSYSFINWDHFLLSINFNNVIFDDSLFYFEADTLVFKIGEVNPAFFDNQRLDVCIKVRDNPNYCSANETTYCWNYSIAQDAPRIQIIEPLNNTITHQPYQQIKVKVWDKDGLDTGTMLFIVQENRRTFDNFNYEYVQEESLMVYSPSIPWVDFKRYDVSFIASDIYGNQSGPVLWSFYTDYTGPVASEPEPGLGDVHSGILEQITLNLSDYRSGVDINSLILKVDEILYSYPHPALQWDGYTLYFLTEYSDQQWIAPDTVWVSLESIYDKTPDYGTPNFLDNSPFEWYFFMQLKDCWIYPEPFTPNDDGYNDQVSFNFKESYSNNALIHIYDLKGKEIKSISSSDRIGGEWFWDGRDSRGNELSPGVYIYSIIINGKTVYNGSITLAR